MNNELFLKQSISSIINLFDFELLETEIYLVNKIEKTMDPKKVFEEKWKIANSKDKYALSKYYSNLLSNGTTHLNEAVSNFTSYEYAELNKKLNNFQKRVSEVSNAILEYIKLEINEQTSQLPTDDVDFSKLEKTATSSSGSSTSTIFGTIESIARAITNNYSPLGILQLALDIIGALPIPGVSTIADLINAAIYYYNKEYTLAILSAVSIIPGGDLFKLAKPFKKPLSIFFRHVDAGDVNAAAKVVKQTPALTKILIPLIKALSLVGKVITDSLIVLDRVFKYISGFIPSFLGGKKIKAFFESIEKSLLNLRTKFSRVDEVAKKALSEVTSAVKKIDATAAKKVASSNTKILKEGGEIVEQGGDIVYKYADGTTETFSKATILQGQDFVKKFPNASSKIDIASGQMQYSYLVAKINSTPVLVSWLESAFGGIFRNAKGLIFLGKMIIKYFNNDTPPEAVKSESDGEVIPTYDDADYVYVAAVALTDYVEQTIANRKKQTGEIYNPTVVFNSMDAREKQGFDFTQSYIRDMARKTGQPSIIPVIYDRYAPMMSSDEKKAMDGYFSKLAVPQGQGQSADLPQFRGTKEEESLSRVTFESYFSKFK